jgi:hypothetical protein
MTAKEQRIRELRGGSDQIQAARRPVCQGPAGLVANSAAKDEQRSKKQRGTNRDRAAMLVLGWGHTGMMPLSCNGPEGPLAPTDKVPVLL